MAVAKVQSVTGNGATVVLNGCVAGNALVVLDSYFRNVSTGVGETTPTDSGGTFSVSRADAPCLFGTNDAGVGIFHQQNIASGTHTVTPQANSDHHTTLTEYSGLVTTGLFVAGSANSAKTADTNHTSEVTGTTSTAAAAGDLAVIALCLAGGPGVANVGMTDPVSGYTSLQIVQDDSSTVVTNHAFQVLASGGTKSATFNWTDTSADQSSQGSIATFVAAGATSTTPAPKMPGVIWMASRRFGVRPLPAQAPGAGSVAYVWLPTGGFILSGTAPVTKGKVYAVSGGLTFGGTGPYNKGKVFVVSGGLVFGGVASTLYTTGTQAFVYTPSGGLVFGGTAPYNKGKVFAVSGGLVFAGSAPLLKGKVFVPSGGLVFSGNATLIKGKVYVVSGGLTFGGSAPYEFSGTVVVAAIRTINSPLNVGTLLNRS